MLVYPDGAADQTVPVVDFEDPFEQLVSGRLVRRHLTFQQVDWLGHAPGEVHQGVGCVPSIQSLIAAVDPAGRSRKAETGNVALRDNSYRQSGKRPICWHRHSLGVGLLHQGAPELVAVVGVTIDQLVVDSR